MTRMTHMIPDRLAAGRLLLARERPYLASALWALQPIAVPDMAKKAPGPIGVDPYFRLYYDPVVIDTWDVPTIAGVLNHEVGHLLRSHAERADRRLGPLPERGVGLTGEQMAERLKWNIAGDMEINDDLAEEKEFKLPDFAVYPKTYKLPNGLFTEEYYDLLHDKVKIKIVQVACGSGAGGAPGEWEEPAQGGQSQTGAGVSSAEAELIRQRVAQDITDHIKNRGTVPAGLSRWAKDRMKQKVDWRRALRALIRTAVGNVKGLVDFTYSRPSRRQSALPNVVLPSMQQPTPRVAVVVDTSGSMSDKELAQALTEIAGVLVASGHREGVHVFSVDAAAAPVQKVFRADQIKLSGGGGTDMRVGIEAALAMKPKPHLIIVCTDCETPWPDREPSVPVVVAKTSRGGAVPAWAKVVDIVPEDKA